MERERDVAIGSLRFRAASLSYYRLNTFPGTISGGEIVTPFSQRWRTGLYEILRGHGSIISAPNFVLDFTYLLHSKRERLKKDWVKNLSEIWNFSPRKN